MIADWRDGLSRADRIDVLIKAANVEPDSEQALTIACDEFRDYTHGNPPRHLNSIELEWTARDTLADIQRERTK